MDKELIERLWAEACRAPLGTAIGERFATLVAEECAKVCDGFAKLAGEDDSADVCADAIREKFKP